MNKIIFDNLQTSKINKIILKDNEKTLIDQNYIKRSKIPPIANKSSNFTSPNDSNDLNLTKIKLKD